MKKCNYCKIEKEESLFSWAIKDVKRQPRCKECQNKLTRKHYKHRKSKYKAAKDERHKIRQNLVLELLLKKSCVDCGESDPIVLDFDHINPKKKEFCVSQGVRDCRPIEIILEEISKCEIRCANCHRRKTSREGNHFRSRVKKEN
jgi:hypothetical protein